MSDTRSKFLEVYSVLKSELLNDPAFEFTDDSRQWVERVILNLPPFLLYSFHFSSGFLCDSIFC